MISDKSKREINKEILKYPINQKQSAVMSALTIVQNEYGWLPDKLIKYIANYLDMPDISVKEISTFYSMYETQPVGKYKITLCTNLPCQLGPNSGSNNIVKYIKNKLKINFGETTIDKKITLKRGQCMGACGDAPLLLLNNHKMYSFMNQEKINQLLKDISE